MQERVEKRENLLPLPARLPFPSPTQAASLAVTFFLLEAPPFLAGLLSSDNTCFSLCPSHPTDASAPAVANLWVPHQPLQPCTANSLY